MTKHLKDMSLSELKAGYEKGKVTDEELTQTGIKEMDSIIKKYQTGQITFLSLCCQLWNTGYKFGKQDYIEHEYQKLKDND